MNITGIHESLRCGEFPTCLDVNIDFCETSATFYWYPSTRDSLDRIELRYRDNLYKLFLFKYPDQKADGYFKDSELIWSITK